MGYCRLFLAAWLLLLVCLTTRGQETLSNYSLYTVKEGLPSNSVHKLLEDSYGYLWVGTSHGLSRFNGNHFQNFTNSNVSFPLRACTELLQPNDSLLLAGTFSGVVVYNLKQNRFENFRITEPVLAPGSNNPINAIVQLPGGKLLFSAGNYIVLADNHLRLIRKRQVATHRLQRLTFRSPVFLDPDSTRILTGPDFMQLDTRTLEQSPSALYPASLIPRKFDHVLVSLKKLDRDHLLFSYWGNGFSFYNTRTGVHTKATFGQSGGEYGTVWDVCRDRTDTSLYWLSTGSGVMQLRMPEMTRTLFTFQQPGEPNPDFNLCMQTIQDRFGNTWFATRSGLVKISRNRLAFTPMPVGPYNVHKKQKQSEFDAAAFVRGKLWLGTYGSGLFEADPEGRFEKLHDATTSAVGQLVHNLQSYRDTLYVTTYFNGLHYYDEGKGRFLPPPFLPAAYRNKPSFLLYFDDRQRCWASFDKQLLRIDVRTGDYRIMQQPGDRSGLPQTPAFSAAGTDGDIWFGVGGWEGKLFRWNDKASRFEEEQVVANGVRQQKILINCLFADRQRNLWIGTHEYGLIRRDAKSGRYTQFTEKDGLKSAAVYSVTEDANGAIWAGTEYGISVLLRGKTRLRSYTTEDGLPANSVRWVGFPDGSRPNRLLALMQNSLCWVRTEELVTSQSALQTYIEAVFVNNQRVGQTNRFPHDQQQFIFHFSGVNLGRSEESQYAYRLKGLDPDWIYNGSSGTVHYSGLRPGRYTFLVRTANGDGVWSAPASYDFTILPPFWKTWWFYLACAVALFVFVYGIYRYQLSKAIAMYQIRSRISRDLHDDVGSMLSSISLINAMAARQPKEEKVHLKISESLQKAQDAMSDIVWMINPKNDDLENLTIRFGEVAAEMLEPAQIAYSIHMPSGEHMRVPMEKRRELFMIYKECLNNIVKYADCTQVRITLSCRHRKICLTVEDNGKGFCTQKVHSGNGLYSMRQRAEQLKGQLHLQTVPGKGTTVELSFPVGA